MSGRPMGAAEVLPDVTLMREAICVSTLRECKDAFRNHFRALISTGSLARDEASFVRTGNSWTVCGDAEFMIVFEENAVRPSTEALFEIRQRIESNLLSQNIQCKIDLSAVHPRYFRKLPAHIFTYELKHCGQVIWGDDRILRLIPDWPVDQLSQQDAWRLLCNRMIELLECAEELRDDENSPSAKLHYKILKLYLDMATSFLVFERAYAPTYRERQKILLWLADKKGQAEEYPFDLEKFADLVGECTTQKLEPYPNNEKPSLGFAIQAAHELWRWELARLTGAKMGISDRQLFAQWMRIQPLGSRVRGWLYVLRACGWHRSYRHWLRWLRLGRKASPRYWIYFVASVVLFQLTADENRSSWQEQKSELARLGGLLPIEKPPVKALEGSSWESVASGVVWNYRTFVVATRA